MALKHRIDELYTAHPFYGSRKLAVLLSEEFGPVNRKRVQRCMQEMGIAGIAPGPNLSRRAQEHRVYPYLLRNLAITRPNKVWGSDITYIRLRDGWLYLVVVLDWFSRYAISWALSDSLELPFVLDAVGSALKEATPEIWNSDQGSHYTSPQLTSVLEAAGARISMDGKGRALDNIFTERFWRTLKYENIYLRDYDSPRAARIGIADYMRFYNTERPHQALDYRRPVQLYRSGPGTERVSSAWHAHVYSPQCQAFTWGDRRRPY